MIEASQALLDLLREISWIGALVFFRVSAAVFLLPAFGAQTISVRIKLGLSFCLTAIVAPAVGDLIGTVASWQFLLRSIATEAICGLALGFSIRLFIWILQVAGAIAAQSTSLSQILGAATVDPQPAIAQVMVVAGLALAMIAGLHVDIARALILSYDVLPVGQFPVASDLSAWGLARIAQAMGMAFAVAAPFAIAALIYNLALGAINRAMPQLMVAFVGAPAITAGGLALMVVTVPLMLPIWLEALTAQLSAPFQLPR